MQYNLEESNLNVTLSSANFDVKVSPSAPLEVIIGEAAKMEVAEAINYIESGKAELQPLVEMAEQSAANALAYAERAETAAESFVADKTFVFEQGVAADVWEIQHNLNKKPSVTIVDSAENIITAEVEYIDSNNIVVSMNGATTGKAYLN